jgi:hypothetical protein
MITWTKFAFTGTLKKFIVVLERENLTPEERKRLLEEEARASMSAQLDGEQRSPNNRGFMSVPSSAPHSGRAELTRALDRLDVMHPAPIPIGAEPATTWRGEMVE